MNTKKFKLSPSDIAPIVQGMGGCIATDRLTVDGLPVGYMYRENSINEQDSGWRFFAGDEDDVYIGQASNLAVYDVNTILNLDPDILPFIDAEVGARFERDDDGAFIRLE